MASPLLATVLAQDTATATLRRALGHDRAHHAYLFAGAEGVGKERAAFGLAQALVCERRGEGSVPKDIACGECSACARAVPKEETRRPVHPDVIVLERGLYEPAVIGRRTPEATEISIDQIRTLVLARASFAPHEGRAKVFILRRAEELSIAAANALLKTLEEPAARTHFVLLSSQPDALLPTIRSRTQTVRFAALPSDVVTKLLVLRGVDAFRAAEIARLAAGSMESAVALADPDASEAREAFVARALAAIDAPDLGLALDLAEDAKKSKGDLPLRLTALASALGARAASLSVSRTIDDARSRETGAAKAGDVTPRTETSEKPGDALSTRGDLRSADAAATRYQLALAALRQLDSNASAQLVVESLFIKMRNV